MFHQESNLSSSLFDTPQYIFIRFHNSLYIIFLNKIYKKCSLFYCDSSKYVPQILIIKNLYRIVIDHKCNKMIPHLILLTRFINEVRKIYQ